MGRKTAYIPKPFESINQKNLSTVLYASMLQSKAWMSLNKGAQVLYLYMKLQYYGAKNIPDHSQTEFYFNWALASKTYRLYTNHTQFQHDRDLLIKHGFIEVVSNGKSDRSKSIYKYSSKWQLFENG